MNLIKDRYVFLKEYKAKIKAPDNYANRSRIMSSNNKNLIYLLEKDFPG